MSTREAPYSPRDFRKLGHEAVTEGVNLAYVEVLRRALYAAADRIEELEAGEAPKRLAYWIVRDEGDSLAYWGPYPSPAEASGSGLYEDDGVSAIVALTINPTFARAE